jgi:phenylalanyl-tRNA synthetase beta chain
MKNPLSESMAFLRTSLIPDLIEKVDFNAANGNPDLRLFELGNVFLQKGNGLKGIFEFHKMAGVVHGNWIQRDVHTPKNLKSSAFSIRGGLTSLAARFGIKDFSFASSSSNIFENAHSISLRGKVIGFAGAVSEKYQKKIKSEKRDMYGFEIDLGPILNAISETTQYNQINPFPISDRDLNFVLSSEVLSGDVSKAIRKKGGELLQSVEPVNIFYDDSLGKGCRSVTFRIVFQHPSKTLEDSDVNPLIKGIIDVVTKKFDGKLRS